MIVNKQSYKYQKLTTVREWVFNFDIYKLGWTELSLYLRNIKMFAVRQM